MEYQRFHWNLIQITLTLLLDNYKYIKIEKLSYFSQI